MTSERITSCHCQHNTVPTAATRTSKDNLLTSLVLQTTSKQAQTQFHPLRRSTSCRSGLHEKINPLRAKCFFSSPPQIEVSDGSEFDKEQQSFLSPCRLTFIPQLTRKWLTAAAQGLTNVAAIHQNFSSSAASHSGSNRRRVNRMDPVTTLVTLFHSSV